MRKRITSEIRNHINNMIFIREIVGNRTPVTRSSLKLSDIGALKIYSLKLLNLTLVGDAFSISLSVRSSSLLHIRTIITTLIRRSIKVFA